MRKSLNFSFRTLLPVLIILMAISGSNCSHHQGVTAAVNREIIITYPFYDPDPIPVFARSSIWGSGSKIYPYFVFNGFSTQARPEEWTVVRLKNRYLEVTLLPEVGGKIWGARDLITGKYFLYTNHVLKFREIALRGPWTSGGIEFNFGIIGHSPATATPVDYHLEQKTDGSLACTVGNYDWPSGTRWRVTVTVYPDKAYFETRALWLNPGPYHQSYYAWMCAAVPAAEDLKYIFPGKYQIGHDYSVALEPWPVDRQGRDLSWYRNNAFGGSKSYFVLGTYDHFYGGYYQNSDSGFGHWALYPDMPGKKIWIWDLSRAGEIWVDLLTDGDGQYTEPQSGRLLNQSDHGSFSPAASDSWKELWFPYSGIGAMTGTSPQAVLSLSQRDTGYELGVYALAKINETLAVEEGDTKILSQSLRLDAAQKKLIKLENIAKAENLIIKLGQKIILQTAAEKKELNRPFNFYRPAGDSVEALFLSAQTLENEREYSQAVEKYLRVVEKEPDHLRALSRLAELFCRRGQYHLANGYARRALEISRYDPEANYLYGLVARRLGRMPEAKETFGWAARSPAYALAALIQLTEIALFEKDYSLAEEYALRALNCDQQNPLPYELLLASLRQQNRKNEARKICQKILSLDPLDHIARYELYLLEPKRKNLEAFKSSIKNEFPANTYLELALYYHRIGEKEKASELLKLAPENPEILAWLAYLQQEKDPGQSRAYLAKSAEASPYLVFPFREESIPVFNWAIKEQPDCWKFRYYLGLIFWHKGRIEEARELFQNLTEADYYPVFIARACLNQDNKEDAWTDLKRAVSLSPEAWRTWHHLITFELSQGHKEPALKNSLTALEKFPDNIFIQVDMVKALMANSDYQQAADRLDRMKVLPYEGASEVHSLFARAHLHLALDWMLQKNWLKALEEIARSRDYPEHLGTGRPYDPDQRFQDYLESLCQEKLGWKEPGLKKLEEIIRYTEQHPEGPYSYFGILALEKLGRQKEAEELKTRTRQPEEFWPKLKVLLTEDKIK